MNEKEKLNSIESDVIDLAGSGLDEDCPWEYLVDFCMRIWLVNPKDESIAFPTRYNGYNDYITDYFDIDIVKELLDMYCKAEINNDMDLKKDLNKEIKYQFDVALVKLYGSRVKEWWDNAPKKDYESLDDIGE